MNNTNSQDQDARLSRVFVGHLKTDHTTKTDVYELFEPFGFIKAVSLHRGFAFVQYDNQSSAMAAVTSLQGTVYKTKALDLNVVGLAGDKQKDKETTDGSQPEAATEAVPEDDSPEAEFNKKVEAEVQRRLAGIRASLMQQFERKMQEKIRDMQCVYCKESAQAKGGPPYSGGYDYGYPPPPPPRPPYRPSGWMGWDRTDGGAPPYQPQMKRPRYGPY